MLALSQDNLKARLAFSTVSQLSYIVLGAALLNASGVMGGVAHITNHAVSKITLFFCAGSIYVSTRKTEVSQLSGLAKRMPWTMAAFSLASLSIVGIPLTSGFVSKWYLVLGAVELKSLVILGVLLSSSLLSAAYLGPIVYKAYFEPEPTNSDEEIYEVRWMVAPLAITAAFSLLLGLFPGPVLELAEGRCREGQGLVLRSSSRGGCGRDRSAARVPRRRAPLLVRELACLGLVLWVDLLRRDHRAVQAHRKSVVDAPRGLL